MGGLLYWLGQNAAAVQGFTAIVTVVLTIVLIGVTIQYVQLTRGILEASEASMRSSFLPDLDGSIEVDSARRDRLHISIANAGLPPFRIVRAKVVDGTVHQWSDPPSGSYKEEAQFRGGALPELANRFLRKEERAGTVFIMVPVLSVEEGDWLNFQKRSSLTATVVVEVSVSDISGRVFYSFRIMRRALTGSTRIDTFLPSVFDST